MTIWRLRVSDANRRADGVLVEADPATTVASLAQAFADLGYQSQRVAVDGRVVSGEQRLEEVGLVNGVTLDLGGGQTGMWPGLGTYVVVVAGPDTAHWAAVAPGGNAVVGRSASCDLTLDDSLLSGQHLRIRQSVGGDLFVTDLDSTNGVELEGAKLAKAEEVPIALGDFLQVGTSIITVVQVSDHDLATLSSPDGNTIPFQRRFREAVPPPELEIRAPRALSDPGRSFNASWLRMLAPLAGGVGMALVSGRWQFLLIMIFSPVIYLFEHVRQKRKRAKEDQTELESHQAAVDSFVAEVDARKLAIVRHARALASPGGIAGLYGQVRHQRLWERSSADPDFGSLTIGLAEAPSGIKIQGDVPDGVDLDLDLWARPLSHSLLDEGPLAVVGDRARARAVARSMILELATAHSPLDLKLWVFTDETGEEALDCLRWLPHAYLDDHSTRIASTAESRALLLSDLQRVVKNRKPSEGGRRDQLHLPVHVAFVDGAARISTEDLTELLALGPVVGVTGITVDDHVVPEGTRGLLKVGALADTASFSSRTQPQTRDVITFEITAAQADQVNRRLAGIRPISSGGSVVSGTVRLCDLADANAMSVERMRARWATGPTSRTVVGVDGEVPIAIDVMKDGPHGLVGGTTRSGKTEFLKSFLMGLCLANHPDDLNIVIIDFKGGVDHQAVAELPHVVDLSTNADIAAFERATALLTAEIHRREELFREAGTPNLDAYRVACGKDPGRTRLPRLVVVVDEYGELLSNEAGKASLGKLESITRVGGGLGIHLLLVTQNFESQLPAQISANAGMRICFRVQEGSHSKIVLAADDAASIPAVRVGRAFHRFHGGEIQEFQSARVAGPRPGSFTLSQAPSITIVAFGALALATPLPESNDVPIEETDLFDLIEVAKRAAAAEGWIQPLTPWPEALPVRIDLDEILLQDRATSGSTRAAWVIGRADLPDQQRNEPVIVSGASDVPILVGGMLAGLADAVHAVVASGVSTKTPDELHVYVIDQLGQGFGPIAGVPHCGGVATRNDQHARRILHHVRSLLAERRSSMLAVGAGDVTELRSITGDAVPDVLLIVHGADRLILVGDSQMSPLYQPLYALASEVGGSGIGIMMTGGPALASNRLGASATRKLVFSMPGPDDFSGLDVPRPIARSIDRPGLGWDSSARRVFQIGSLPADAGPTGEFWAAIGSELRDLYPDGSFAPPLSIQDISWPLPWLQIPEPDAPAELPFPIAGAINVETGDLAWLDADDDGPVLVVAGPPKSGRSTALLATGRLAKELGYRVVGVPLSRRSPLHAAPDECLDETMTFEALGDLVADGRPLVVLVDDAHRWTEGAEGLSKLLVDAHDLLVVVAGPVDFFGARNNVTNALGSIRSAMLLTPSVARDGSTFGIQRLPDESVGDTRAGRGVLVVAGEAHVVQVPLPT